MTFKFDHTIQYNFRLMQANHKISTIQKKFLVLFNLLQGLDIIRSGSGLRAMGCASLL